MGMEYRLGCNNCNTESNSIEFSIIRTHWVPKNWTRVDAGGASQEYPEELPAIFDFLVAHSGHRIEFKDGRGNVTKPHEITGGYVIGLTGLETI